MGYLSSIFISPESKSAAVVLANVRGLGDGSDWTAQAIIQSLFDLQSKLDFQHLATAMRNRQLKLYSNPMEAYEANRQLNIDQPPDEQLIGRYLNEDICMQINIFSY